MITPSLSIAWSLAEIEASTAGFTLILPSRIPVPKGKAIKVITETPDTLTLVIPPPPAQTELADDGELEAVAGGVLSDQIKAQCMEKMRRSITIRPAHWRSH